MWGTCSLWGELINKPITMLSWFAGHIINWMNVKMHSQTVGILGGRNRSQQDKIWTKQFLWKKSWNIFIFNFLVQNENTLQWLVLNLMVVIYSGMPRDWKSLLILFPFHHLTFENTVSNPSSISYCPLVLTRPRKKCSHPMYCVLMCIHSQIDTVKPASGNVSWPVSCASGCTLATV